MSTYYTLLTRLGAALHANAQVNQNTVPWTHMRLGDGNGAAVVPTENQTGLVRQVHVLPITDIAVHPDNPNWVIAEAVVPSDVGGWTVRETAIYGGADGNTCIAVGNYPETYKPVLAEGAGREMVMRMVVQISSVATVKLQIDPAVAIASRAWVESLVATPSKPGLVRFATPIQTAERESNSLAVTPFGLDAALKPLATEDAVNAHTARITALEGRQLPFGQNQSTFDVKAVRLQGVDYTNTQPQTMEVSLTGVRGNGGKYLRAYVDGFLKYHYVADASISSEPSVTIFVPYLSMYRIEATVPINTWNERRREVA